MPRMPLLFVAVVGWAWITLDIASHLVAGDLIRPAFVAITFVAWMAVWRSHLARIPATQSSEVTR